MAPFLSFLVAEPPPPLGWWLERPDNIFAEGGTPPAMRTVAVLLVGTLMASTLFFIQGFRI